MKCIYCGTPLSAIDYCTGCGADVTIQKRTARISNLLYNEGLEKATVRDLSGAISCLVRSLKFNKENIDARNLLGLVYYETGEVVAALSEWVISKNTAAENNAADFYISKLQSNKNKLETINQTIRKYNQALAYCKQDDDDMAVIQLKKVLSQNPNLIKAYHLLALIYIKQQEYEKARKLLKKAAQIDTTNTTTLRYLQEVEEATGVATNLNQKRFKRRVNAEEKEVKFLGPVTYQNGNDTVIQPATFRESSAVATSINILLGVILGAAFIWFLAIPANTKKINKEANQQVTDTNTKLASESAKVTSLEDEIEEYKQKIDEADSTMKKAEEKAEGYDALLKATNQFLAGNQSGAGETLADVSADALEGDARTLYDTMMVSVKSTIYASLYSEGTMAYGNGDYETAIKKLKKAVKTDDTQYDAWYYLAFAYYNSGDTKKADETLAETIVRFPANEATLAPYITDQTVLTKAKTDGTASTGGSQTAQESTGTTDNTQDVMSQNVDGTTGYDVYNSYNTYDTQYGIYDYNTNTYYENPDYGTGYGTYDNQYGYDTGYNTYDYGTDYNAGYTTGYYDAYGNWIQ